MNDFNLAEPKPYPWWSRIHLRNLFSIRVWLSSMFTAWLLIVGLALAGLPPSFTTPAYFVMLFVVLTMFLMKPLRCEFCGRTIKLFGSQCRYGPHVPDVPR